MLKFSKFALLSALLAVAAGAQAADDKVAALVNGTTIPQTRVDLRVKIASQQSQQPDSPKMRADIREDLINLEVISQAAVKSGLDKQPETAQQIELARQSVLAGAFVQDYAKSHPISETELKQEYETLKKRLGDKEYKLSNIQVETEDEAKAVAAELKKGAKFAKVAKAKSKDQGSKDSGGDIGWTIPANLGAVGEAVLKLGKGQVTGPVQTQYGWHIFKLEDIRDLKVPAFEEVKPNIENRLQQQAFKKAIDELRSKAKVE